MLTRILLTTDAVGGIWCYSMELARGFAAHGVQTVVAVLGPGPNAAQLREADAISGGRVVLTGLPLDWLANTPQELEAASKAVAQLAVAVGADTVQLHAPALLGRVHWPMPVVAVVHSCVGTWWQAVRSGPLPPDLAWRAEATSLGISGADVVIVPTESFGGALRECYGVSRAFEVVLNGRTPLGVSAKQDCALTAGRLWDEGKNITTLDRAANGLDWPIRAAGATTGPNGAGVACQHLDLLGSLDEADMARQYAMAAVFVSVAVYEPFGLAVLEAAHAGCALVLSDIPTFRELWGEVGVFVPVKEPDQIAEALQALFRQPDEPTRLGNLAIQRASLFSTRRMIDDTLAVHQKQAARTRVAV